MTVSSEVNKSGPYIGNGATTVFDYDFKIVDETHLKVIKTNTATLVETILVLDTDYTVADVGNPSGGQVTALVAPSGVETITILLYVPFTQETDLENQGAYYAETVEAALDLAAQRDLQLKEEISRAVQIPASSDPSGLPELVRDIIRLGASADNIDIVATNIADVNTVANNMTDVNAVAELAEEIGTIADEANASAGSAAASAVASAASAVLSGQYAAQAAQQVENVVPSVARFSGDGVDTTFDLDTGEIDENMTSVYIGGVYQQKDTYSVAAGVLTFSAAPPAGSDNIEVVIAGSVALAVAIPIDGSVVPSKFGGHTSMSIDSRVYAQAAIVRPDVSTLTTNGYYQPGDGGGAVYVRAISEPGHAGKLQTVGGQWWEIAPGRVSVKALGARGDGVTSDDSALLGAVSSGYRLLWPEGTYRVTETLRCESAQDWHSDGATLLYDAPYGSPAAPAVDFVARVVFSGDMVVDHQAHINNYGMPEVYEGNIIAGSAILVQGDRSIIEGMRPHNAWDNGIAVVKLHPVTGLAMDGLPKYWRISGIRSEHCGCGVHDALSITPGKIGAGVDIASGSAGTVSDCVDFGSYAGFILDIGAGASAVFSNCVAWFTRRDPDNPFNGSGYGFYVGSGDSQFTNCASFFAEMRGFWYNGQNCDFANCLAYFPQREGLYVKGSSATFSSFRIKGASQTGAGDHAAVWVDASADDLTELSFQNLQTTGVNHSYGVLANGAHAINAGIVGGTLTGTIAKVQVDAGKNVALMAAEAGRFGIGTASPGFDFDHLGKFRAKSKVANIGFDDAAFGDTDGNGSFFVESSEGIRLAFGWDPEHAAFVLQAIQPGVIKRAMHLNPSGGAILLGLGGDVIIPALGNYADDAAAASAGVGIDEVYRSGNNLKIRVS